MKSKTILVVSLLIASSLSKADTSCIGITSVNPVTFVTEQHPLRHVNCPCNCSESRHLEDSTCITCNHKHAHAQIIQTAKTNGNFVNFMPPAHAKTSCPTCPNADWVETLVGYVETKTAARSNKKEPAITAVPYSESKKK